MGSQLTRPVVVFLAVVLLGLPFTGAGWVNGDQAVYLDQAARGAWTERWTHVGYVLLHAGWGTPWRSDLLTLVVGALAIAGFTSQCGKNRGILLAVMVLPWLPFGEVDVLWFAGIVSAALLGSSGALPVFAAVCVSPTALVAVPWLAVRFSDRRWVGGPAAVLLLTLLSAGAWWTGRRGVVVSDWTLAPLRQLVPAVLVLAATGRVPTWREGLALSGILLAPSDVPAGWVAGLAVLMAEPRRRPYPWVVVPWAVGALGLLLQTHGRIEREEARLAELALSDEPVEGSWSWRKRVELVRQAGE